MKKILNVALGAFLATSWVTQSYGYGYDLLDYAGVYVIGDYTEPSNNGLSVGDLPTASPVANGFDGGRRALFLDPRFRWDYTVGITFDLCCQNQLFFQYDYYNYNQSREDDGTISIGLPFPPTNNSAPLGRVRERENDFILGLAHWINFGPHFAVNVSAYAEYERLTRHLFEESDQTVNGVLFTNTRFTDNKLRAYGPGIGILGRAYPGDDHHWSFFAGIMTTLFYAKNHYEQLFLSDGDFGYDYEPEDSHSVIAKININAGVDYCFEISKRRSILMDIAVGVRYLNIFNAFKNGDTAFNPLVQGHPNVGTKSGFAANTGFAEDWGRWGPYIQLSVGGW